MTQDAPSYETIAVVSDQVFDRPPTAEETDNTISADPWILRKRLTLEAYATRCRLQGKNPDIGEYLDHVRLTDEELALLNDLVEAKRDRHVDELRPHFIIREYGNKARVGWFGERGELGTMSFAEFRNAHLEKVKEIQVDNKPKRVPLVDYWLHHPLTTRYDRVEYRLGVPQSQVSPNLNLWRGWPHNLRPGWEDYRLGIDGAMPLTNGPFDRAEMPSGYCDTFIEHILLHMCGGDQSTFKYLLGWVADALWNPGPCETAIVLTGPQGSGKTVFAECIMEFFGVHAITLDDPEQLLGNFNKHLQNKSLVFADEAFFAGNKKHASKLKTLITGPDIFIEPKGVDGFVVPKQFRLIFASNDEHVIQAEQDDRRNLVLRVDAGRHNQDREYFSRLRKEWVQGGRTAFFRWLTGSFWKEEVAEGRFRMWDRPVTADLQAQKNLSLPEPQLAIFNMLREGDVPGHCLFNERDGTVFVSTLALIEGSRMQLKHQRAIGDLLRMLAGPGAESVREYLGDGYNKKQHRGSWLPSLQTCRERLEKHLGRRIEWPENTISWTETRTFEDREPF
jgi:hypothetical protein